jgi:competence protein CoiA
MLTAIRLSDSTKVLARVSERPEAPFICPLCRREVILRKGKIKVHHFAHKPPVLCSLGAGETEAHHRAKLAIYDALKKEPHVTDVELEKNLGGSIADVYARIAGVQVAVEIQRSALTVNEIVSRSEKYHRLHIAVLWIGLASPALESQRYTPRAWEKWCHAAYFGRVYYWEDGQILRVAHFDPFHIHVESSTWYQDGQEQSAGGYDRISKRWRTPKLGIPVLLAHGFNLNVRAAWSKGAVSVPACTLYVDRQPKWWKGS